VWPVTALAGPGHQRTPGAGPDRRCRRATQNASYRTIAGAESQGSPLAAPDPTTGLLIPAIITAAGGALAAVLVAAPGVIRALRDTPTGRRDVRVLLRRLVAAIRGHPVWTDIDPDLRDDIEREVDR
jgi:hypothetical protein